MLSLIPNKVILKIHHKHSKISNHRKFLNASRQEDLLRVWIWQSRRKSNKKRIAASPLKKYFATVSTQILSSRTSRSNQKLDLPAQLLKINQRIIRTIQSEYLQEPQPCPKFYQRLSLNH